ncbi:hypothetical protein [Streptomyces sp. NPDC001404]|uniref:hypothetical protein n=1 Tax=Streptomyces sp. NPDC001404 TaxID=3364571 RepID=UPI00367ED643
MPDSLDVPEALIELQRASDAAGAAVHGLQDEIGPAAGDWSDEQRDTWAARWAAWRDAADRAHTAITEHAESTGASRYELEKVVKQVVRHAEPEA